MFRTPSVQPGNRGNQQAAARAVSPVVVLRSARPRCGVLLVFAGMVIGAGCNRSLHQEQITCFAAASTIDAMTELLAIYESRSGQSIRTSYASSSSLAMLMIQGAEVDLFLSASSDWAEKVAEAVPQTQRFDLLSNQLVLVVPADSANPVSSLDQLTDRSVRRVALADPQSVPAGIYARRLLTRRGLWQPLRSRIAATADVRQALALVETGAADAGLVYASDAAGSNRVKIVERFPETARHIVYPLLCVTSTRPAAGRVGELVEFLRSGEAASVFSRHGFVVLPRDPGGTVPR